MSSFAPLCLNMHNFRILANLDSPSVLHAYKGALRALIRKNMVRKMG